MGEKRLDLERARARANLDRFAKENPSSGVKEFDELLET